MSAISAAARPASLLGAALLLVAAGPAPDRQTVSPEPAMSSEPAPLPSQVSPPAAIVAPAPTLDLHGLSPANRARALADARRWAGTLYVGSSVADGKLRDLIFAPWTGSWGADTLTGGSVSYRVARFWTFFMVDVEVGGAYRFGETEGGEFWAVAFLRYDGFPWTDHVYTTFGLSMGPDYVTRLPRVERGTDALPERNQSRWLNFFSPELTLALPEYPQYEVAFRYMHRSGIFGTFNGVYEGANSFAVGLRYRF